jgi:hypothetical protein
MIKGNRESKAALFILPMLTRDDIISNRSRVSLKFGKVLHRRDNRLSPEHMSLDQLHARRILLLWPAEMVSNDLDAVRKG